MMTRQQMMMWDVLCGMSGEEVARAMTNYHGNRLLTGDFAEFLVDEGYCEPEEVGLDPDDYDEDDYDDDDDDDAEEDFDHYEVCSDGLWYKFYERDNAVAFACGYEYPIFGVKDGKREPVQI